MRVKLCGSVMGNNYARLYRMFGFEVCCPKDVRDAIESCPEDEELVFEINSGGGSAYTGFEMYSLIRGHKNTVAEVQSIAASAASVFMAGCSTVKMSPVAQVMIHRASTYASGNSRDMKEAKQMLDTIDESILTAYVEKAGGKTDKADFAKMMRNETFMTAQEAIDCGLADEIMEAAESEASAEELIASAAASAAVDSLPPIEDLLRMAQALEKTGEEPDGPEAAAEFAKLVNGATDSLNNDTLKGGVQNTKTRSESNMDQIENKEQLEQQYPELTAQIKQEAAEAAAKEAAEKERNRIAGIDALAMSGFEDIIAAAKADPTKDAGSVAQEMILAQKKQGENHLARSKNDAEASGANSVPAASAPAGDAKETEEQAMNASIKSALADWQSENGGNAANEEGAEQ